MRKEEFINAIMDKDLYKILIQTGQYEEFINGNIRCECCGRRITIDNISTLMPYVKGTERSVYKALCLNIG